ncbi:hypothetical protein [Alkalihalophilus marmarensis]|uniref:DUF7662 domain-containing protein n=1 Tax=Alkalihalophilus marmarensis TaxID=521377 RepID=UPI002E231193|nr:hypothetical protein [Alkalihalophilus marmarensis]
MISSASGKYLPLFIYLNRQTNSSITMSFEEIEDILQAPLPASAYQYSAWWSNSQDAHSHTFSWLEAGFAVHHVTFGETIQFKRIKEKELEQEEEAYLERLTEKLETIKKFFVEEMPQDFSSQNTEQQFELIKSFRRTLGNIDNDQSFLGCLMIKQFLEERYSFSNLNMALKPQGAPGLDFDERTTNRLSIIGELKTTLPYKKDDLGASQKASFLKDFIKLQENIADQKYFFVTEELTFDVLRSKYSHHLSGVKLVLLPQALHNPDFVIRL